MWIQSQHFNPVWHFDATGSIIRNIPGDKMPLLHSMVSHDTSTKIIHVFPCCNMYFQFLSLLLLHIQKTTWLNFSLV
jgi:hypothetical protein